MSFSTKSKRITLVILVIIAASGVLLWFLWRMHSAQDAKQEQKEAPQMYEITDQIIAKLVIDNLGEKLPVENLTAHIAQDGTLTLRCV